MAAALGTPGVGAGVGVAVGELAPAVGAAAAAGVVRAVHPGVEAAGVPPEERAQRVVGVAGYPDAVAAVVAL